MPPKKNPVKPKGKMTAYAFFVNACRLEHHNQFPGQKIKLSEFSTVCAKRWKEMTMEQKRPFAEMADRDKMRYENELKLLFPGESQPKRRRKKKDPNAPKKNLSPFFIFSKMKRPEIMKDHPSKGVGEISKVLSLEWSAMGDEEKSKYIKLSEEDKVRYQKQLEQYKIDSVGGVPLEVIAAHDPEEEEGDEEEEDEDEFGFSGSASHSAMQGAASAAGPGFQQQMMAPSTSGAPSNQSQFVQAPQNGQAQMYQQGMMMTQQPGQVQGMTAPQGLSQGVGNMGTQGMTSYPGGLQQQQNAQHMQPGIHPGQPSPGVYGQQAFMVPAQQQLLPQQSQTSQQQGFMDQQMMQRVPTTNYNPQQPQAPQQMMPQQAMMAQHAVPQMPPPVSSVATSGPQGIPAQVLQQPQSIMADGQHAAQLPPTTYMEHRQSAAPPQTTTAASGSPISSVPPTVLPSTESSVNDGTIASAIPPSVTTPSPKSVPSPATAVGPVSTEAPLTDSHNGTDVSVPTLEGVDNPTMPAVPCGSES